MTVVNTDEVETQLLALLKRVQGGEEIAISNEGRVVAKLVAAEVEAPATREPGFWKGKVVMS